MASDIWVWESVSDFRKIYTDPLLKDPPHFWAIVDMYLKPRRDKRTNEVTYSLWVSLNTDVSDRPLVDRSRVIFFNDVEKYLEGDEILIKHGTLKFNKKKCSLQYKDSFWSILLGRSPRFSVSRFINGNKKSHVGKKTWTDINYDYRYFDMVNNRINLILEEKN